MPFLLVAGFLAAQDLAAGAWDMGATWWALGTCAALYGLWYLGLFGGADAKGLMVLAWLAPVAPALTQPNTTVVIDTLLNASLVVLALPLLFVAINGVRGDWAFPAILLGIRTPLANARAAHVWPMQRVIDGRVHWKFRQRIGGNLIAVYAALARHRVDPVWITPKVPFMVPLFIGFILQATHGNLALRIALAGLL